MECHKDGFFEAPLADLIVLSSVHIGLALVGANLNYLVLANLQAGVSKCKPIVHTTKLSALTGCGFAMINMITAIWFV